MKSFLKILLIGFVGFMIAAVAQEWGYFSSAWFGGSTPEPAFSDEDRSAAAEAVRQTLVLMEHLYGTGGDPRFAERMPVSPTVLAGMMDDIEYLRRNHRRQEPRLQNLQITEVKQLSSGWAEIETREYWIYRIFWITGDGAQAEPPYSQVIGGRYLVGRQSQGWRVERWELGEAPPLDQGAGES